jgi:hypothetical protein
LAVFFGLSFKTILKDKNHFINTFQSQSLDCFSNRAFEILFFQNGRGPNCGWFEFLKFIFFTPPNQNKAHSKQTNHPSLTFEKVL